MWQLLPSAKNITHIVVVALPLAVVVSDVNVVAVAAAAAALNGALTRCCRLRDATRRDRTL